MGRPKKSKADKIRELLAKGKTVAEIIKRTGATPSYVYAVKSKLNKEKAKPVVQQQAFIGEWKEIPAVEPTPSWFDKLVSKLAFWR